MIDLGLVDRVATAGDSLLHRCDPSAKIVAFVLVLFATMISTDLAVVTTIGLTLSAAIVGTRLPARPIGLLAAYPGIFAAIFAFATASPVLVTALVVVKAMTSALAALLLVFTTPYPQVFAPVQRVMPQLVGDALLMTYRSLFLLAAKTAHVLTAARLRAGVRGRNPVRAARLVTTSLASALLYSVDLSQRTYDVMYLRGYEGRIVAGRAARRSGAWPLLVVAAALAVAALALAWRLIPMTLAPFAWIPLLIGLTLLAVGIASRLVRAKEHS